MNRYVRLFIFTAALGMALVTLIAGRQDKTLKSLPHGQQENVAAKELEKQFPLVDYAAPDISNPELRAERQAKSGKYNDAPLPLVPSVSIDSQILSTFDWEVGLSALPVVQSSTIITGRVSEAKAYLSNDKSAVYSEFAIHIDEVLKNDERVPLSAGTSVSVERPGGRVRFPSGKITLSLTHGQGMPQIGRIYVLFLTHDFPLQGYQERAFYLLTGYELRNGRVLPLDNPGNGTHPMTSTYKGVETSVLLNDLRSAISKASEKKPLK